MDEHPPPIGSPSGLPASVAPEELPPLPQPFEAEPKSLDGSGCGKVALVGCGVMILLVAVASAVFVVKANDMLVWLLGKLEQQIVLGFPDDLPAADRARTEQAFEDLYRAIEEDEFDPIALQSAQPKLLEMIQKAPSGLTRGDVLELTEALESVSGRGPPEEGLRSPPEDGTE